MATRDAGVRTTCRGIAFALLTGALASCASIEDPVPIEPGPEATTASPGPDSERSAVADASGGPPRQPADRATQPGSGQPDPRDPIAVLQQRIDAGDVALGFDSVWGYLPALLEELDIPISSQGLVFSRTSLQTDRIAPWTPRALYFNDEVYVGSVLESSFLEIASIDPEKGAIFYTLNQDATTAPEFKRETTTCLMCHESRNVTQGVPGLIMLSVLPDRHGWVVREVHEGPTTDRTPMERRWGGWYVTGTHGSMRHAGNTMAPVLSHEVNDSRRYLEEFDMGADGNVSSLDGRFDLDPYLSGHSDIVGLMVLTHQVQVHNLITAAGQTARDALRDQDAVLRSSGRAVPAGGLLPTTRVRIDAAADRLVRAMLFSGEAPLEGQVLGASGFAEAFQARGPRDSRGRSLRDMDLDRRLMRYPLSFLIYSEAFDAMPDVMAETVHQKIWDALTGAEGPGHADHIGQNDRSAILEILRETKPDFFGLLDPGPA